MPGDIVAGLDPAELAEIRRVSALGAKVLIEAVGLTSHREIRRPLSQEEVNRLERVRGSACVYDGDPEAFLLGAEAERIRIGHQFDPLFAVNSSIVDPLPHQVDAVYRFLLPLPRIRFLLADDTGAGKTIMTGLLIKELIFRGAIEKVLIITPGGITKQWKEEELGDKFALDARLVNRASFEAEPSQFSRQEGLFVVSIDFLARNEACLKAACDTQWDMVVVDEAHKLSAYEYGAKVEESDRYKAVKALSERTDHLLFLTATPHRGRKDTFRRLLALLDADLFQKDEHVSKRVREEVKAWGKGAEDFDDEGSISKSRNRFFLRRLKEEMVNWDDGQLFKPRHTNTAGYDLTPEERTLYEAVTKYVRSRRKEAKAKRNRNVELTLMVMQRRLASSLYAITRTLHNRLTSLDEVLQILRDPRRTAAEKKRLLTGFTDPNDPRDISEYEDLSEDDRDGVDKRIFRQVLSDDPEKVEAEREEVEGLYRLADSLKHHREAKYGELLKVLESSNVIRAEDEKLLIFTEHKDTMDNLAKRLSDQGYSVVTIHGQMDVDARRQAQREFRGKAKIMVATDAAGEGINLQFCRYLINWDIPWNPNRLEQRMGRVHRYGQEGDVHVYNLVAQDTREGAVLHTVLTKLDVMREQMGSDRVYDVVSDWLEDVPLVTLLEKAIDVEDKEAIKREAQQAMGQATRERADRLVALQKKGSLASRMSLREARKLRDDSEERRLQPRFIQDFFERAWTAAGGTLHKDSHFPVWHVGATPTALLDVARDSRKTLSERYDTPFVFDKLLVSVASRVRVPEHTKLLGPGHPLFEALIEWAIRGARQSFARGALLVDPNLARPQRAWLVRSTVRDSRKEERKNKAHERLAVLALDHIGMRATSPSYLLVCVPPEAKQEVPAVQEKTRDEVQVKAYEEITEKQLSLVRKAREEECDLRRSYLETAFTDLILELQAKINDLQEQSLFEETDADEMEKLRQRIAALKQRKVDRMAELDLMLKLSADLPEIVAQAIVLPAPVAAVEADDKPPSRGMPMRRDDEVEAIAMDVVMRYERSRNWTPIDVHADGEHYDIRSESPTGEKRCIEVKGRASSGPIVITGPEVEKLAQLEKRAWLYVVTFCKGERPRLRIIQDPIAQLDPKMLYKQVQFLVDEKDWSSKGEEVPIGP